MNEYIQTLTKLSISSDKLEDALVGLMFLNSGTKGALSSILQGEEWRIRVLRLSCLSGMLSLNCGAVQPGSRRLRLDVILGDGGESNVNPRPDAVCPLA